MSAIDTIYDSAIIIKVFIIIPEALKILVYAHTMFQSFQFTMAEAKKDLSVAC